MEQPEQLQLELLLIENTIARRSLIPVWMKIFIWLFMFTGTLAPFCFLAGFWGINCQLSLYGFESNEPLSPVGIFILLLFLLKGIVAYGLWTEKDWGVNFGIADAVVGTLICTYVTVIHPFLDNGSGFDLNLRLELIALIPYWIKLHKIKPQW